MNVRRLILFLPLLLLLPACRVRAEEISLIDAAMRKADPRLSQPVTLNENRLPLGALLERLSEKTGVSLRMDNASGASGAMLLVVLHNQPLADTMNALYAFFGYRKAGWEWHRSGEAGKYEYFFAQSQASSDLAATLKQQARDAFKDHAKVMFEIARMTPEERKRSADKINKSLLDAPNYIGQGWVNSESKWQALRAFQDSVKPEDQQKVLEGGAITVPMADLTDEGKAFAIYQAATITHIINGERVPSVPEGIHFRTVWAEEDTAPVFFAEGMSELAGVALQRGLNLRQSVDWLLEGDTKTNPAATQTIKAPEAAFPEPPTADAGRQTDKLALRLQQMAHEMPQSLIAHLPDIPTHNLDAPYGKTPEEFLARAAKGRFPLMWKWRGDTLLIEYPAWYLQQGQNIPYSLWKPFAQAVAASQDKDALPLSIVAKTIAPLSEAQWKHLLVDAPYLEPAGTLQGLFGLAVRFPDMLRENGALITPALADDLAHTSPNRYNSKPYKVNGATLALRIRQKPSAQDKDSIEVSFEAQDQKKVWYPVLAYTMPRGVKTF